MANGLPLSDLNLIDIFGYLVPGTLLVAGFAAAIAVDVDPFELPPIVGLTLAGMFAFVVGMVVSSLEAQSWFVRLRHWFRPLLSTVGFGRVFSPHIFGTRHARYEGHSFPNDLFRAQEREADPADQSSRHAGSDYFDHEVLTLCRRTFSLPDDVSEQGFRLLWLSVLSYLETTPHSRAFRMQALFEFSKNMLVVSELLSVYYLTLLAMEGTNRVLGPTLGVVSLSVPLRGLGLVAGLAVLSVVFMDVFARLSSGFLSQWHLYSKMEFYIARTLDD